MLYFVLLSATITWWTVFTVWLARYPQLLFRTARWGFNIWMLVFGLLGMRAVTAGFDSIDPEAMSNYPAPSTVFWFFYVWYGVVCLSVVYQGYLTIAFLVLLGVVVGCPELRTLMDHGLISLGWLDWVYNPGFTLIVEILSVGLKHRT